MTAKASRSIRLESCPLRLRLRTLTEGRAAAASMALTTAVLVVEPSASANTL